MKLFVWDFHGVLEKDNELYTHSHLKFKDCNPTYKINDLKEVLREL